MKKLLLISVLTILLIAATVPAVNAYSWSNCYTVQAKAPLSSYWRNALVQLNTASGSYYARTNNYDNAYFYNIYGSVTGQTYDWIRVQDPGTGRWSAFKQFRVYSALSGTATVFVP